MGQINSQISHLKTINYVTNDELLRLEEVSTIQRYRVLLRGYLYEFQERAVKYVLDNLEQFQDTTE